jgi:hypothetical protein
MPRQDFLFKIKKQCKESKNTLQNLYNHHHEVLVWFIARNKARNASILYDILAATAAVRKRARYLKVLPGRPEVAFYAAHGKDAQADLCKRVFNCNTAKVVRDLIPRQKKHMI